MKYRNLSDCHVHSDCSRDGNDSTMMMCESASRLGLSALTITDHCECNTYLEEGYDKSIQQSFFEAKKANLVFGDKVHIYTGIELGQPVQNLSAAENAIHACNFDFTLASVHNIRGMEDFYSLDYSSVSAMDALYTYFDEILETIEWGKFDSLAHLTYPLRYITGEHNIPIDLKIFDAKITEILTQLVQKGKALEVNTSGLRQKIGQTLPPLSIIKRFKELGGKYVTLGSDAHRWADVGAGIEEGFALLKQAGFHHFTIYVQHEPIRMHLE